MKLKKYLRCDVKSDSYCVSSMLSQLLIMATSYGKSPGWDIKYKYCITQTSETVLLVSLRLWH